MLAKRLDRVGALSAFSRRTLGDLSTALLEHPHDVHLSKLAIPSGPPRLNLAWALRVIMGGPTPTPSST